MEPTFHLRGMRRALPASEVIRFEADDNYTNVYITSQDRPLCYGITIGKLCQRFGFMLRISRTHAVNPAHIQEQTDSQIQVSGTWLTASPHYLPCDQHLVSE